MENKFKRSQAILDEETRKKINGLSLDEAGVGHNETYDHEILWYGIDSIAHIHLIEMAKSVAEGKTSKDEFIEKYGIEFGNKNWGLSDKNLGFIVPLKKIESDGIFIPQHAYYNEKGRKQDRKVWLFNRDYGNKFMEIPDKYPVSLIEKEWKPSDLEDLTLIEQGIKFGKDMWETCVKDYEKYKLDPREIRHRSYRTKSPFINWFLPNKGRICNVELCPISKKVIEAGESLIKYYSAIIESY